MRLSDLNFGGILLFERVAALGTIVAAARELGISASTATRRLADIEAALGTRLFIRSTRQMMLTDAGQQALDWATEAMGGLRTLSETVSRETGAAIGRVRMAAPHRAVNTYLPGLLASFLAIHPDVTIELTTTDTVTNLIADGFDIALRYGTLPDSSAVAVRLSRRERVICASPAYLRRHGVPDRPEALRAHRCIVHVGAASGMWSFRDADGRVTQQSVGTSMKVDNAYCLEALCRAGAGVARLDRQCVEESVRPDMLVEVLTDYRCVESGGQSFDLWLVRTGEAPTHRVRLLIDHLKLAFPAIRPARSSGRVFL